MIRSEHVCTPVYTLPLLSLHAGTHSDARIDSEDAQTKTGARGPSCTHPGKGNDGMTNRKNRADQVEPSPPPLRSVYFLNQR